MNPALLKARNRAQAEHEKNYSGTVVIEGVSYPCAAMLDPVRSALNDSGNWELRQTVHVSVRKSILSLPPSKRVVIQVNGVNYKLDGETGGQNEYDVAWLLQGSRKLPSPS